MTAKFFVDTNIVLYTIGQDKRKAKIARDLVASQPVISTQVVNESISVCLRKLGFTKQQAYSFADSVMRHSLVLPVDEMTIRKSAEIAVRYQLSNWDALIVASALLAGCDTLYSEDLQHQQVVEALLTIINPFVAA